MLKISNLFMDYEKELTGVTHMPQFSWKLESDRRNIVQKRYELQIAKDADFETIIYDSGIVTSSSSAQITVKGCQLESLKKYFVRVRVEDEIERTSYATASFITGLIDHKEWRASFITAEEETDADNSKGTYVRKVFGLSGKIKEAYVCTTALGIYNFYMNGKKVGTDELTPGWTSYKKHLCYQTYDVTEYLEEGLNAMGAILAPGWYKGRIGFPKHVRTRNHYGKVTAFLAQLLVRYEDGKEEIFITDDTWNGYDAPVVFAEIYDGEIYDARKEIEGFSRSDCVFKLWRPVKTVEYDFSVLTGQACGKVARIEEVKAKEIFVTPQGDTVVDFGQNMSAQIQVTAEGKAGDIIKLECFETLDFKGNVYTENLRTAKAAMTYIFGKDGRATYSPSFTYMGFRYAKITEFPGKPKLENFTAFTLHSKMERTGFFECSNPDLNQLGHNILWGMKSNFVDIPSDCPQRDERMGWTGDAEIFCRTASYLMNTYNFYRKWLVDVEADQKPDGGIAHVVPDIMMNNMMPISRWYEGTYSAAAWADAVTILPWTLYLTFADVEILRQQYSSMKKWIGFMEDHSEDYVWSFGVQLGDWVALDAEEGSYFGATPESLICTAYFVISTQIVAKSAKILGFAEDEKYYTDLYGKILNKFQELFWDEDGNMTAKTQTAHIVALYFGLVPEQYRRQTAQGLIRLLEKENGHLVTGFIGTPYFCHALSQNGHVKEAYDLLLKDDFPSWLYQVKMGATTVWEHWDGMKPDGTMWSADMNSFNHYAYGAICEWIVRVAAGLEIDESQPGYKHTVIYPRLGGGLSYMKGEYNSVYGPVKSFWKDEGDYVELQVTVPPNATATVCLDQAAEVVDNDGLKFERKDGILQAETGSGVYSVRYVKEK
jgi:alpha-L-rhamnosidase